MNHLQLSTRRLRAPRENRSVVVEPPWSDIPQALEENIAARAGWEYDFQGISAARLMSEARAELCSATIGWNQAYSGNKRPFDAKGPILLAGHQPQMFHPGVWLKNFALGRLAEKHAATAVNLIIDSDAAAHATLLVPVGSRESPGRESLAYDLPAPIVPYEERRIEDRALFESFAARAIEKISPFIKKPLLEKYWPLAVAQSRSHGLLGASLAQARHLLETQWSSATWEVPQSAVCDQPAFFRFAAHMFAHLPKFASIYNAAVAEYRHTYRIRNHAHPVPDLAAEGDWLEAPFWIWTAENPRRRRLFVRASGRETILTDRRNLEIKLSISPETDAGKAVEQLADWRRKGVKIRSRALVTTLWARLVLSDLFIHGIGGGHYDQVTDAIIERFFHILPPQFMVLTATLFLPLEHPMNFGEDAASLTAQLREMTYHPERYLGHLQDNSGDNSAEALSLMGEKLCWIELPQTRENAKRRCRRIREINERLQPWLAGRHADLKRRLDFATAEARKAKILNSREYGFPLYPEEPLREFFDGLLREIS